MDATEKRKFIRDLTTTIRDFALEKVPNMPADWDGHELRQYLADKFQEATYSQITGARKRAYRNTIAVSNL